MVFGTVLNLTTTLSITCYYFPDQCVNQTTQSYPPPVIQYGHQNQTLMVNDMAILPCQATGRTPPKISWLKNGMIVNFTEGDLNYDYRYRQLTTGTLQISDLKKSDTGVYTCRAKNEDGEATWTASLIVEEHTNPTTLFQRMPDAGTFPSSPGKPLIHNVTDESADLEWTPPDRHGATPVVGYILQYWSPELGETWYNVLDVVPSTRFRVKNLLPNHSYVFVVRAENSNGIGPPSALSEIILTKNSKHDSNKDDIFSTMDLDSARQKLAAEQLIKLVEVKSINATAMSLTWKRQKSEPLVQGYYIKWRGPPLTPDHSWVNVTDPRTTTVIINGLKPFTNYEFFVIPYHRNIQGMPSNSLDAPSLPPSNVRVRMLNLTTLRVLWRPPPSDGVNGILKGYQIVIIGNTTEYSRNISTNERAASVTLFHLEPGKTYKVRVAAKTNAGIGVYHGTDSVTMNEETLREHLRLANEGQDAGIWYVLRRPWAIALLGIILWLIVVAFAVLIWYRWKNRKGKAGRNGMPFIKINDGSVLFTARDGFWLAGQHYGQHNQAQSLHSDQTNPMSANQSEYYAAGPVPHLARPPYPGTLARTQTGSPHHYHYAQLPERCLQNGMTTFAYGMRQDFYGPEYQDDPSPYATTTLVMNGHSNTQPLHFKRHDGSNLHSPLVQPKLPTGPIPSGPPQHLIATMNSNGSSGDGVFHSDGYPTHKRGQSRDHTSQQELCQMNGMTQSRGALTGFHNSNSIQSSDSPHTDVSFVQSSDGTNGSGKNRMTLNRGSPPRHILDFVPPPPPTDPPPHFDHTNASNGYKPDYRSETDPRRKFTSGGENYDSVSDLLLPQNGYPEPRPSPKPREHSLYNGHTQHASTSTPKQFSKNRSRHGLRKYEKNGRRSRGTDDDESQRSSLMGGDDEDADDEGGAPTHRITYESDNDGELSDSAMANQKNRRSNPADTSLTHRPNVPVMGVSASTLSQNDASLPGHRRSTSRIKSLPRNSSKKDVV